MRHRARRPRQRQAAAARVYDLLAESVRRAEGGEIVLVVLAADSHPTSREALGRMVVFDGARSARTVRIRPADVAPSIVARTGVPAARDLPGRPVAALFFSRRTGDGGLSRRTGRAHVPATPSAPESDKELSGEAPIPGILEVRPFP